MTHYRSTAETGSRLSQFVAALLGTLHAHRSSSRRVRRRLREIETSHPASRALAAAWALGLADRPIELSIHG